MSALSKYGFSSRLVPPQGTGAIGVLVLGEAPGQDEDLAGIPFCPWAQAGSVLERAITRRGYAREQFVITNCVPWRPPNNWLEGSPWCAEAIAEGEPLLAETIRQYRPRAILALGGVATRVATGLVGEKLGVTNLTGYLLPSKYGIPCVPCFHPSYLRRGKMSLLGVMMRAIQMAVLAARGEIKVIEPPVANPPAGYILHPTEEQANEYCKDAAQSRYLSYDIETPWSGDEDVAEEAEGEQAIKSIQLSHSFGSGVFLSWREPFVEIAKRALASHTTKLSWNGWKFDAPILKENGCAIAGEDHDLMWTWHHLQPDLPRGLQFAAGQQGWPYCWKHLDKMAPAFYGIVDVDVLQWMIQDA